MSTLPSTTEHEPPDEAQLATELDEWLAADGDDADRAVAAAAFIEDGGRAGFDLPAPVPPKPWRVNADHVPPNMQRCPRCKGTDGFKYIGDDTYLPCACCNGFRFVGADRVRHYEQEKHFLTATVKSWQKHREKREGQKKSTIERERRQAEQAALEAERLAKVRAKHGLDVMEPLFDPTQLNIRGLLPAATGGRP